MTNGEVTDRLRGLWECYAARYDRDTGFYDLLLLGESRSWACSQAFGQVLEVAIGTGRNLPFYPRGIQLTGIDFSPAMLEIARGRAAELGVDVTLIEADAQHLGADAANLPHGAIHLNDATDLGGSNGSAKLHTQKGAGR